MKSIIYVTTATSGSASIMRILSAMLVPPYKLVAVLPKSGAKATIADFEPEGHIYLVRGLSEMEGPVFDRRFRYIVNFRDPRDTLCNQYHWLVQHPPGAGDDTKKAKILADRAARHALGIDASVLRVKDDRAFSYTFELQAAAEAGGDILFVSYAQLCCAFDMMIDRLSRFLDMTPSDQAMATIALERAEQLDENPNWIGQQWTGTDIMPGRHRQELKPETIQTLTDRFAVTLRRLKMLEIEELRYLYD